MNMRSSELWECLFTCTSSSDSLDDQPRLRQVTFSLGIHQPYVLTCPADSVLDVSMVLQTPSLRCPTEPPALLPVCWGQEPQVNPKVSLSCSLCPSPPSSTDPSAPRAARVIGTCRWLHHRASLPSLVKRNKPC